MSQLPMAFRETIQDAAIGERKYIRYFAGRGHFAHLKIQLLPRPGELCALTRAHTLEIPDDCYHAARAAIVRRLDAGPIRRFPMHGLEVQFLSGTYLPRHSYPEAFALAAQMAFDDALAHASPVIIEPWVLLRLPMRPDVLAEVFKTLTRLLGKVDASVAFSETFSVDAESPRRLVPRICHVLGLRQPQTLALPSSREYRPLQGSLPASSELSAGLSDWT